MIRQGSRIRRTIAVLALLPVLFPLSAGAAPRLSGEEARRSADALALTFIRKNPARKLGWSWGQGVFLYGLLRLAQTETPHRQTYLDYLHTYYERRSRKHPKVNYPDRCTPGLAALGMAQELNDLNGLGPAGDVARYLRTEKRNSLGAIDHLGSSFLRHFYARSIWVDSLMMYGIFSARWAEYTSDPLLMRFALDQPVIFASRLQDPQTGLFWHAWLEKKKRTRPKARVFWLRGNGWAATSLVEMLEHAPAHHPARPRIGAILSRLMEGLIAFRNPAGLWETVVNRQGYSYEETSGAALAAYGMARGADKGFLDPSYLERAWETFMGLQDYLVEENNGLYLRGISRSTNPSSAFFYKIVPKGRNIHYGVGAYLLLASELSGELK